MWIDSDGTLHTVALPDPELIMAVGFMSSLGRLASRDPRSVAQLLDSEEELIYERAVDLSGEGILDPELVGAAPPEELLERPVHTIEELRDRIRATPMRWRLDAIMAMADLLDTR